MSDKKKQPILLALGDTTVRIEPRTAPTSYLQIQIIEAPHYNSEGHWIRDGRVVQLWMTMEHAKLFADAIYAQEVMELVE